jgi:hypothetical protein
MRPSWRWLPGAATDQLEELADRVDRLTEEIREDVGVTARSETLVAELEKTVGRLAARSLERKST